MANVLVRNLDDDVLKQLKAAAKAHGPSSSNGRSRDPQRRSASAPIRMAAHPMTAVHVRLIQTFE
jgi:hypothetical protein